MYHQTIKTEDLAPAGAILALKCETAAAALAALLPNDAYLGAALDRTYGKGNWFLFWDEDLSGKPIRGTISLAYGKETLVVG
jgi:hypothetical protein